MTEHKTSSLYEKRWTRHTWLASSSEQSKLPGTCTEWVTTTQLIGALRDRSNDRSKHLVKLVLCICTQTVVFWPLRFYMVSVRIHFVEIAPAWAASFADSTESAPRAMSTHGHSSWLWSIIAPISKHSLTMVKLAQNIKRKTKKKRTNVRRAQ